MKNAPNLKKQPADKMTEVIIFAGSDAWTHAKAWTEKNDIGDTVPPVYLGPKQLAELDNLTIVSPDRYFVRVNRAGALTETQISVIGRKLAVAGVQQARFLSESHEEIENWTLHLPRWKEEAENGTAAVLPVKKKAKLQANSDELKPRIESRDDGIFWITPKVDKDTGDIINTEAWLCSPLEIAGAGTDSANQRFLVLRWEMPAGRGSTTQAIPCGSLSGRAAWETMMNGGVSITTRPSLRTILADWLQRNASGQEWRISHTSGWHYGAYIMPDGEVIGEPETPILFDGRSAAAGGYTVAGTAESWRNSVARLAAGNPSMMLGVAASMAAPLIGLVGADGFGVHLFEQSSAGKTTTANIASSIWGDPDALRLSWYGTALGIANEAEAHNDGLLPLDEVGQGSSSKDVAIAAYTLFNGAGKLQGAKEGGNRELKRWRTVAISTGEMDIETFLSAGGLKVKAGQLVRLLNVPMEKSTVFNGQPNGKAHADALKESWLENHGAAGREWVKWLASHQQEARQVVRDAQTRWRGLIPADYGEQVHRVAERFAILEAGLLLSVHITGWGEQACRDAIQHSFNAWVKEFGTGNKEHQQIIEQCEAFLNAYGFGRFAPLNYSLEDLPISELMGYRDSGERFDDPMLFYVLPEPFKKHVSGSHNKDVAARILYEAGMLRKPASGKNWQIRTPRLKHLNNARPWTYVLLFAPESEESENE
ncbi:DUF927 domain-containing protein [Citrobacter portucalensis]|uniref:DUF927 domain-containing protein n=1 Tax=Citrobacter portucalensis TaxID=1639133 RepID=UPI00226B95CD|nr:DUF927 domain-containing protein [Citrobacter portucalensis]MCX8984204.1 DUF927 domain-containing protein [Citrobacter portucalensis]